MEVILKMGNAKLMIGKIFQGKGTQLEKDILDDLKQQIQKDQHLPTFHVPASLVQVLIALAQEPKIPPRLIELIQKSRVAYQLLRLF